MNDLRITLIPEFLNFSETEFTFLIFSNQVWSGKKYGWCETARYQRSVFQAHNARLMLITEEGEDLS